MIKHPSDRYQRRIINERKKAEKAKHKSFKKRVKEEIQEQETSDELKTYD